MGGPGGSWGSFLALLGPRRAPRGARSAPGRRQGGQKRPRRAPRRPQGPPKGPPKSRQERSKITAPRSIVKYGVSFWKIAFSLGLAAFLVQYSRPNRRFLRPTRSNTVFYEAGGGPKGEKLENMHFRREGRRAGRLAFFGGSGPRKITKNALSRERCCKNKKNNYF